MLTHLRKAFVMPTNDGTYDFYLHVEVGLAGMQGMLQSLGCWTIVQDVSTSNVLKLASCKEKNLALLAKYWSKVGLASFRCMDGCATKIEELLNKYNFYMMFEALPVFRVLHARNEN